LLQYLNAVPQAERADEANQYLIGLHPKCVAGESSRGTRREIVSIDSVRIDPDALGREPSLDEVGFQRFGDSDDASCRPQRHLFAPGDQAAEWRGIPVIGDPDLRPVVFQYQGHAQAAREQRTGNREPRMPLVKHLGNGRREQPLDARREGEIVGKQAGLPEEMRLLAWWNQFVRERILRQGRTGEDAAAFSQLLQSA